MSDIEHNQIITYAASEITNDSGVAGADVATALDNAAGAGNPSVFFLAELSSTQPSVTGDSSGFNPVFDFEVKDTGNDYDHTTGIFTAPVTGFYMFNLILHLEGIISTHTLGVINFNAGASPKRFWEVHPYNEASSVGRLRICRSWLSKMGAAETANINFSVSNGTKVISLTSNASNRVPQWGGWLVST